MKNYGIIDIGSNSVRLLFNGEKEIINTQLSEKHTPGGPLLPEAVRRTVEAVMTLADKVRSQGGTVQAFATEAVRSASDGKDFVKMLNDKGVPVDILSPDTEALIGFNGAYEGEGIEAILDVGGASSELIVGSTDGIIYSHSLPLGSVRTKDIGLLPPELNKAVSQRVVEYGSVPKFCKLIGIGGTATSLLAVRDKVEPYDKNKIHKKTITVKEIEEVTDYINSLPEEERKKIPGLHPKKIFVVPAGGVLIAEIMRYLNINEITISEDDNLEGYQRLLLTKQNQ